MLICVACSNAQLSSIMGAQTEEIYAMLSENIRSVRRSKGLSQEELAVKLHVVRQTISKWEQGLSVPDAQMLISLAEVFEIPVSTLLGEPIAASQTDDLKAISEKLEVINLQLSQRKAERQNAFHWAFLSLCAVIIIIAAILIALGSPYLSWNFADPEMAAAGILLHAFEWLFSRSAPILLMGGIIGAVKTRKKE